MNEPQQQASGERWQYPADAGQPAPGPVQQHAPFPGQPMPAPGQYPPAQYPPAQYPAAQYPPAQAAPPRRSGVKTAVGVLLLVLGLLGVLSLLGRAAMGTLVLYSAHDPAGSLGGLLAIACFTLLPLWGGVVLLRSHGRAMDRWRRGGR